MKDDSKTFTSCYDAYYKGQLPSSKFVIYDDYVNSSIVVIVVCSITAFVSITLWAGLGKFLRKFATNNEFIKRFNYAMSILLVGCVASFYL